MSDFATQSWFLWALAVVVGFPFAAGVLGQLLGLFEKRRSPATRSLWYAVNLLLPVAALFFIVRFVMQAPPEATSNRLLLTVLLVLTILVSVSIFNAVFFGGAPKDSWRGRTPKLLRDIILSIMLAVGGAIVLAEVWDQDVTALLTALGVGSVVLGFALQETLGNVMLGLSMLMERPFSEGDEIQIGDVEGMVEEINWRATRIEVDGNIVIVPHAIAAKETIVNLSRPNQGTPVSVTIGFSYEHPPNRVRAMLLDAVTATEQATILPDKPELGVFVEKFADSAIEYKVTFLAGSAEIKEQVIDRFMTRVWYAAQRMGLNIPFPIRTLHYFDGDKLAAKTEQANRTLLDQTRFLSGLLDAEALDQWAGRARFEHHADGEIVLGQNEPASNFYLIASGSVLLRVRSAGGDERDLFRLERGDVFGETTVLAGAETPYTARAVGDVQVLAVAPQQVHELIERRPSMAMEIGRIIDSRRRAVQAAIARE